MNRLIVGASDKHKLLLQLLADDFSRGVLLIDPTGDLARGAANIVPLEWTYQTLYLDPADIEHPIGFNILENVAGQVARDKLTRDICAYFDALFPEGPTTLARSNSNFILANCLRVLLDTPGATMLGILKLLTDRPYRAACLANCTDPVVLRNWSVIEGWDHRQSQAAMAPLQNKIGTLLMSPVIRNIVGQTHSTFSLEKGKIIIANLDTAKLGDTTARLLGSLLIARSAGTVYINDLAFFATDHLATLLLQERLTVSLNFLAELRHAPVLRDALLSIAEKYVFRTNLADAKELAFYLGILNPRVLTELDALPYGLEEIQPPPSLNRLKAIKKRSRAAHTRPRKTVEEAIEHYLSEKRWLL